MNKSVLIAIAAVVTLVLWMLSGQTGTAETPAESVATEPARKDTVMKVQTRLQDAEQITREIILQGQVEPLKVIHMRSEASGTVQSIRVTKGQRVDSGDVIAELSVDNRNASLAVAKAYQVQAANEYKAVQDLQKQGLQSKTALESMAATLASARAQVQAAEIALEETVLRAPSAALVDELAVEEGDFIDRGGDIATLVDNSQLLITGNVPQQNIIDVKVGAAAIAKLITGETMQGTVSYLSSMADTATRSFRVEILVSEPPKDSMTGISAEIRIPVETLTAHLISPAILALDDQGTLGVKAVNDNSLVTFHAIEVVKTQSDGAWVTGIPANANIITLGQGFVSPGEKVQAILEEPASDFAGKDS